MFALLYFFNKQTKLIYQRQGKINVLATSSSSAYTLWILMCTRIFIKSLFLLFFFLNKNTGPILKSQHPTCQNSNHNVCILNSKIWSSAKVKNMNSANCKCLKNHQKLDQQKYSTSPSGRFDWFMQSPMWAEVMAMAQLHNRTRADFQLPIMQFFCSIFLCYDNLAQHNNLEWKIIYYSLIAFDKRVTFWLQRVRS